MAIPKRLRYEILRRDNYACRYCGGRAPDVELTVDHVRPVVLGGTDEPTNLAAACKDCNGGKTSSSPDAPLVAQVNNDAIRWAAVMRQAIDQVKAEEEDERARLNPWLVNWNKQAGMGRSYDLPPDWRDTIRGFLNAGLPMDMLINWADVALRSIRATDRFPYFVGIANNKLRDYQDRAAALLPRWQQEPPRDDTTGYGMFQLAALRAVTDGIAS